MPICMRSAAARFIALALAAGAACGLAQAQEKSGMARVAGGTYTLGSPGGPPDARPAHAVTLEPLLIDRFEVTNAELH